MDPVVWPQPEHLTCSVAETWLSDRESEYVNNALQSNWIGPGGVYNRSCEEKLSLLLGQNTLLVSNGSVAIILALKALGIGFEDEVLVPNLTYSATASSVVHVGAVPVFCDVEMDTWGISVDSMERMISSKTKAIIVVHLYGVPAKMSAVVEFARKHGLFVIEDCAESFLAESESKIVGTFGDISTYSFFANKLITSGEGGAVSTKNDALLEKMFLLRGQGMDPAHRYFFLTPGFNFRMTNLQAAVLLGQLDRLEDIKNSRSNVEKLYRKKLENYIEDQIVQDRDTRAPWLFTTRLKVLNLEQKLNAAQKLADLGIETRPVFYPLSSMPAFSAFKTDDYSCSTIISREGITLPTGHHLSHDKIDQICKILIDSID